MLESSCFWYEFIRQSPEFQGWSNRKQFCWHEQLTNKLVSINEKNKNIYTNLNKFNTRIRIYDLIQWILRR